MLWCPLVDTGVDTSHWVEGGGVEGGGVEGCHQTFTLKHISPEFDSNPRQLFLTPKLILFPKQE